MKLSVIPTVGSKPRAWHSTSATSHKISRNLLERSPSPYREDPRQILALEKILMPVLGIGVAVEAEISGKVTPGGAFTKTLLFCPALYPQG